MSTSRDALRKFPRELGTSSGEGRIGLSVVIPALNEEKYIGRCLESLSRQTDSSFEVVVVDNGSTDQTVLIAQSFGVRVIEETRRGIACARQTGFEAAGGSIIASTDADCVVPPDWVGSIANVFREHPQTIAVFGRFRYKPHSAPSALSDFLCPCCSMCLIVCQLLSWNLGRPQFPGSNFAVRRDSFFDVGGFRSQVTQCFYSCFEDVQLGLKLDSIGEVRYLPRLVVRASARKLRSFWANCLVPAQRMISIHFLGREL